MMRKGVHYIGLDVLRIVAATLVVADHFGAYGWASPTTAARGDALAFPFLHGMETVGSIGVEVFFLISGFVISASAQGTSATHFILNRAIRVFPVLWICGVVALVARATTGEPLGALFGFFLRSASLSPAGPYIDGVVWTLVVEAVFYVLIFAVLLKDAFTKLDVVAKVLGTTSAIFLTVMGTAMLLAPSHLHLATLAALCERFPCKVFLLRHGAFFALGMLLWSSFNAGFNRPRMIWMTSLALACTLEIIIERGSLDEAIVPIALWWAAYVAIIFSVADAERLSGVLGRVLQPLQVLGRLSYPLYLNHYVLGMVLVPELVRHGLPRTGVLAVALALVVGSSYLIMRYPERQVQQILRARLKHWLSRGPDERSSRLRASSAAA